MATKTLTTRIIIRNDTAENWTASNPTLLKGEIGQEIDTGKYKLGNGVDNWNLLPYFVNLGINEKTSLDTLIKMLNEDSFGKVNDVMVNNNSVLGEDKVAKVIIGDLIISEESQQIVSRETFTGNIVLHKIAKTGNYNDLSTKLNIIDNLESVSTTEPVSANQARILKQMIQALPTAKAYTDIQSMITALNSYSNNELNVGLSLYLQQLNVPDFWVYSKEETNVPYTYTDDSAFLNDVETLGAVQVGYYKIATLESGKVNLSDYYNKEQIQELLSNYASSSDVSNIVNNSTLIINATRQGFLAGNNAQYLDETGNGGVAIGLNAKVGSGGAIGANTQTASGGAIGDSATTGTGSGGAIGANAKSGNGGAIGLGAINDAGFSGGWGAKCLYSDSTTPLDAIQLGTGTNNKYHSLQVYSYLLLSSSGKIPNERLNEEIISSEDVLILDGGSSIIQTE